MRLALLLFVFGVLLPFSYAAIPESCQGQTNTQPIWTDPPVFLRSVPNGKLYSTGGPNLNPNIYVSHLFGTPYQMGLAQGQLLKDEINEMVPQMYAYIYSQVDQYLSFLPPQIRKIVEELGIGAALKFTQMLTKPYTPQRFIDEVQGMADGSNRTYDELMSLVLFPELIQASCSIMGTWGAGIKGTNGTMYQLRALDWDTNGPLQQWPLVSIYHPTEGHAFATMGWVGFVGSLTGYSSADVAICEKVWYAYKGKQNRAGIPWHFLLRDILQYDLTFEQAMDRIHSNTRTCSIWVGIGSAADKNVSIVQYSYETVQSYTDSNMPNHTNFQDVIYVDKHVQWSGDQCLPQLIQQHYGQLDAQTIISHITAEFQTGDMHIAVMDFANRYMYVSNAEIYSNATSASNTPAYDRPFTRLDLNVLFKETQ